jgi:hypothetical protein
MLLTLFHAIGGHPAVGHQVVDRQEPVLRLVSAGSGPASHLQVELALAPAGIALGLDPLAFALGVDLL